jgi:hypothetical protein
MHKIYDYLLEDLGIKPLNLINLIENKYLVSGYLPLEKQNISYENVVHWERWKDQKTISFCNKNYDYDIKIVDSITRCETKTNFSCDIQDIQGLFASKSMLENFSNLDDMVKTNSKEMINPITPAKLNENLAHQEIGIIHSGNDYLETYNWDKRIFLMNNGGSHHFASARYIASRLNKKVKVLGKLETHNIDKNLLKQLLDKFNIFLFVADEEMKYYKFNDAMRSFKVDFLQKHLPRSYNNQVAIFLPKDNPRANKVSILLDQYNFFNLSNYFFSIC